ncbi:hypothetical protein B0T16DRAFT_463392 [Cercophora newfieldiana]|uniref:Uncharacterized protein n=1 Tax=Cercophora newfieldiana TaxID=92897 RepID=A0AA39XT42_9PEZI|nr:hypothetical protein B0T16DRAFT_463392 [Cercophora newfieldiana]
MAAAPLYNRSPMTTGVPPPLRVRQFSSFGNDTITTSSTSIPPALVADCKAFNGFDACSSSGDFGSCLATKGLDCSCVGGLGYLDCVSASIARSSCWGVAGVLPSTEWDAYERSWFQTACPTPPSTAMAALPQPTTVSVELEAPKIVPPPPGFTATPAAPITQPTSTFTGSGKLLEQANCKSTSFSLVSADNIIMYAAFVGCMADRPECCPWSVSLDGSSTATPHEGNRVAGGPGRFPIPANGVQALLSRCPDDYYSVSGQCCPNGFYKFTSKIAYQTPCFSSLNAKITPPELTAGLAGNPTDTSLPTSAVINVAWAMGYNVSAEATPPLSKGAAIGVGVGAGVFGIALVGLTIWVFFRVRRNKKNAAVAPAAAVEHSYHDQDPKASPNVGVAYPQGYSPAPPTSPPVSPQSTGTGMVAGQYGHVRQFSEGSQVGGYGHARTFSDASVSSGGWTKPSQGGQEYGYQGQGQPQSQGGYPMQEYQQPQQGYQQPQQGYQQQLPPQELPQGPGGYGGGYGRR